MRSGFYSLEISLCQCQISSESYLLADQTNIISLLHLVNGTPASQLSTVNCMKSPSPTPASPGSLKKVSTLFPTRINLHAIMQLMFMFSYIWLDLQFLYDLSLFIIGSIFILDIVLPLHPLITPSLCVLRRRTRPALNVQPNSTHSLRGDIAMGNPAMGNVLNAATHSHTFLASSAMCESPADLFMETIICLLVVL